MKIPYLASNYRDMNNLLQMSYLPKIVNTAVESGLFEILSSKGPMSLEALGTALSADHGVLESLLDVLVLVDFLAAKNGAYALSDLSRDFLVQGAPANQLHQIKRYSGSAGPFDNLSKALGGDAIGFSEDMWSSKEMVAEMEQGAKAGSLQAVTAFMRDQPEFAGAARLCDFAGNTGYYSYALMEENANLHCHVYDIPAVCDLAREVKKDAPHFDRVTYHPCHPGAENDFGEAVDIFFVSHFLYEYSVNGELGDFLKRVNRFLKPGGLFVSHHLSPAESPGDRLAIAMVELMTRAMGYPTHQLPVDSLKKALEGAGFGRFTVADTGRQTPFYTALVAARKL